MKGYIEIEKPSHCIECWLRNDDDNCVMQRDGDNEFIEYDSWEQQIKMCPIKKNLKVHEELARLKDIILKFARYADDHKVVLVCPEEASECNSLCSACWQAALDGRKEVKQDD